MPSRVGSGREARRKTDHGKAHAPDLREWYRYHLPPLHPGEFSFELHLLRPRHEPLSLDHLIDSLTWDEQSNVMSGSATVHRPVPDDPSSLPVARGQLLRCRVKWAQVKYDLWTMRLLSPQAQVDTAVLTLNFQDDLAQLKADAQDWIFRKTKTRPFGYTCDEIAQIVADRLGLKVGGLAKGKKRQTLVKRNSSGYDVLFAAYLEEHKSSNRSYIIRIRNGRLEVVTLQRNPLLYVLEREIQTAQIASQAAGSKMPTTVLTGHATLGKGKGAKKISYTEFDRRVVGRLGYVHQNKSYGTVSSHSELRDKVKHDLASGLRPNNLLSVTVAGIPFILRGDGAEVRLPQEGYKGKHSFVYCTQASHSVQASQYTSTFDFVARDPYRALWSAEDKALRARADKRSKRKRNLTGGVHA